MFTTINIAWTIDIQVMIVNHQLLSNLVYGLKSLEVILIVVWLFWQISGTKSVIHDTTQYLNPPYVNKATGCCKKVAGTQATEFAAA